MNIHNSSSLLPAFLVWIGISVPTFAAEPAPFVSCSFDEAVARAEKEHKTVFIDFYASWCGPCRMLDQTTWKDPKVITLLSEKTIPLKVDTDADPQLSQRFRVESLPALVFLTADGKELDRLEGYHDAEQFLRQAAEILSGKDAMTRAREKLKSEGENNPMARMEYARALLRMGKKEEALKEYLWCFDEGKSSPAFAGVRLSFLLSYIERLGRDYAPAVEALRERRDSRRTAVLSGRADPIAPAELESLNDALDDSADTLVVYDQLKREHPDSPLLQPFRQQVYDDLLKSRRYAELYDQNTFDSEIEQTIASYSPSWASRLFSLSMKKEQREQIDAVKKQLLIQKLGEHYQVLIGLHKLEEAEKLAARILSLHDSAETYNALAWNGYLTGSPVEANVAQARKAHELTGGSQVAIIDTLARVLYARGKKPEAVAVVQDAKGRLQEPGEQAILDECLADFGPPPSRTLDWSLGTAIGAALLLIVWRMLHRKRVPQTLPITQENQLVQP